MTEILGTLLFVPVLAMVTYGAYRILWAVLMEDYSKQIRWVNKKRRKAAKKRGMGKCRTIGSARFAGQL